MTFEGSVSRNMRLAGGRRVRVLDLLRAGLLAANDELLFERRRSGVTHRARVTSDGRIRLDDGQEFLTPSSAARAAAGVAAIDGWNAWVLAGSGELIDTLRQRYLDQTSGVVVSGGPATVVDEVPDVTDRHHFLKGSREAAARGEPVELTVRDLVGRWGSASRSSAVDSLIENDLANHGVGTVPNFRKVGLETTVQLQLVSKIKNTDGSGGGGGGDEEEEPPDRGLTVGNLPSAFGGVESLSPSSTFDEAITKMLLNDYSQLAVLAGPYNLRGAVTWKSMALAGHDDRRGEISAAISLTDAVSYDIELIDILSRLYEDEFVFVRGPDNRISGIVTAADVVLAYQDLSMPFLLVGQIDMLLRRLLTRHLVLEEVVSLCDAEGSRGIASFDDLTIGDYVQALESPQVWARLNWPVDRKAFVKRLDQVRRLRNDITHFNPDPLPDRTIATLKNFMVFLKRYVV